MPTQAAIFERVLKTLPASMRTDVQHASGGLPDARGVSDVDLSYLTPSPHALEGLPEGTVADRRDDEHTIYEVPGYDRPVNLYATSNEARGQRALGHRNTELALAEQYPQLATLARKAKAGGMGTEKAWAQTLGLNGEDPYEAMLDQDRMVALAKALSQKSAAYPVATGDKPELAPPPLAPESPTLKKPTTPKPGRIGEPIPPPDPLSKTSKAHKLSRRMEFRGLKISVETDKGESRHWYDPNADKKGSTKMKYPYGYIRRTKGVDGDHVDVYVGPNEQAKHVYVVHQQKAPNFDKYDEDKCMLGFESADAAKKAYLDHYNNDRFFGSMTVMPFEQFKKKVLGTFKKPQKIAELTMKPIQHAYILGAAQARLDFEKEAGKEVAVGAIRKKILSLLSQKTPGAVDEAAEVARLAMRSGQMTEKTLASMLKGSKSGNMGTQAEQLRVIMAHGKDKALVDPALARSWAKTQGKSTAGLPPVYGKGGKPVAEAAEAAAAPAAAKPAAKPAAPPAAEAAPAAPAAQAAPPTPAPVTPAAPAAAPTAAPAPPAPQTPQWGNYALAGGAGAGLGLGGGYMLGKNSEAALGDPMFWQGGQEGMSPEGGGEQAPPPTAEDAALSLPPGIFQGLQMKVNPAGERATTVKVTPDALGAPDALEGIFAAEPAAKVEMSLQQAGGEGGAGGGPNDMGLPQGGPVDGAGAMQPAMGGEGLPPEVAGKVAELAAKYAEKKTRIERESNPDVSALFPWRSKKTKAERNANDLIKLKM